MCTNHSNGAGIKNMFLALADEGDFGIHDSGILYDTSKSGRSLDVEMH
jgi:hypothetical protein